MPRLIKYLRCGGFSNGTKFSIKNFAEFLELLRKMANHDGAAAQMNEEFVNFIFAIMPTAAGPDEFANDIDLSRPSSYLEIAFYSIFLRMKNGDLVDFLERIFAKFCTLLDTYKYQRKHIFELFYNTARRLNFNQNNNTNKEIISALVPSYLRYAHFGDFYVLISQNTSANIGAKKESLSAAYLAITYSLEIFAELMGELQSIGKLPTDKRILDENYRLNFCKNAFDGIALSANKLTISSITSEILLLILRDHFTA